jgi:hypothetical protein
LPAARFRLDAEAAKAGGGVAKLLATLDVPPYDSDRDRQQRCHEADRQQDEQHC